MGACAHQSGGNPEKAAQSTLSKPGELRMQIRSFHKHLRWEAFDRASSMVAESHRQTFLGRYQEHGEDYDIVTIRIKRIAPREQGGARVEVEQKWYVEPAMTVENERFIELWRRTARGWRLEDRLKKDEWRARQESSTSASTTQTD